MNISHEKSNDFDEFLMTQRIGRAASNYIEPKDTIILDSGIISIEIAKNIANTSDITVITNSLGIASELANKETIHVIIPGGTFDKQSLSFIGSATKETFKEYFCDKLFLIIDGISSEYGISTRSMEKALLNRTMINTAKEVIVVFESKNFNTRNLAYIGPISLVDTIITDHNITEEELNQLKKFGLQIIIA